MRGIAHPNTQFIKSSLKDIFFKAFSQSGVFSTRTAPLVRVFLDTQLIQMCGYIERKCECILWDIGYHDFEERFKLFKDYTVTGIRYDQLNRLYEKLKSMVNWPNKETLIKQVRSETNYDKRTELGNRIMSLQNIDKFKKMILEEYQKHLKQSRQKLPSYSIYPEIACSLSQCPKAIKADDYLEKIHTKRNEIAHFLNFFQKRSAYSHTAPDFNYFVAFSVLIALDEVFSLMYRYYFNKRQYF